MEVSYRMSEQDYLYAASLMQRARIRFIGYLPWFGCALIAVILLGEWQRSLGSHATSPAESANRLILELLVPVLFLFIPLRLRQLTRRQFGRSPIHSEYRTLTFTDEGMEHTAPSSKGSVTWKVYSEFLEDDHSFLLIRQGSRIFVPIPKRTMDAAQIAELRTILSRHLPRRT